MLFLLAYSSTISVNRLTEDNDITGIDSWSPRPGSSALPRPFPPKYSRVPYKRLAKIKGIPYHDKIQRLLQQSDIRRSALFQESFHPNHDLHKIAKRYFY